MPRHQRKLSNKSTYHIMLRGNERKKIFESNEEKQRLLEDISIKQKEFEFLIYAYCIMDNHVHIVINSKDIDISTIMKGIAIRYAYFYNAKYNRVGHVFQDRFKSEAVEDERYLMAVIRYIHNNPVKARIVNRQEDYQWSSYLEFLQNPKTLSSTIKVNTQYVLNIIAKEQQAAIREFIRFSKEEDPLSYLDCENEDTIRTIEQGREYLKIYLSQYHNGSQWEQLKQDTLIKNGIIRHLRGNTNLSVRTIAQLLGLNRNVVERIRP